MTAELELFKNLIPTAAAAIRTAQPAVPENSALSGETFEKAFDKASTKYMSQDSKDIQNTLQTAKENNLKSDETNTKEPAQKTDSNKNFNNENTNADSKDTKAEEKSQETQLKTTEKEEPAETDTKNRKTETGLKNLYESILNNIILGSSDTEKTENSESGQPQDTITNIEDEIISVDENAQVELDNVATETTASTQKQSETKAEATNTIDIQGKGSVSNTETDTMLAGKNETETEILTSKQSTQNASQLDSQTAKDVPQNTIAIDESDIPDIENDILVKSEVSEIDDEIVSKTNSSETTKISQETIESLDVTIRESDAGKNNASNENNKQFQNPNGNAQEDIIRMSIEGLETTAESVESIPETNIEPVQSSNTTITTGTNTAATDRISNLAGTASAATQAKTVSNADILNQITGKISLPQDNTASKVNIILQPENLGKVTVEIMQTKNGVAAKMIAETPQVKELLDKSIESLKNTIASQGVNVSNISVRVEESASSQNANFGFEQEQFNREAETNSNNQRNSHQAENETLKNEHKKESEHDSQLAENTEGVTDAAQDTTSENPETYHNGSVNITV